MLNILVKLKNCNNKKYVQENIFHGYLLFIADSIFIVNMFSISIVILTISAAHLVQGKYTLNYDLKQALAQD